MNKAEMTALRKSLMERRDRVRGEVRARLESANSSSANKSTDLMDIANDSFDDELAMSLARAEMRELAAIEECLGKIQDGSYGSCDECGNTIAFKRLQALPFATLCIECKQLEEQQGEFFY